MILKGWNGAQKWNNARIHILYKLKPYCVAFQQIEKKMQTYFFTHPWSINTLGLPPVNNFDFPLQKWNCWQLFWSTLQKKKRYINMIRGKTGFATPTSWESLHHSYAICLIREGHLSLQCLEIREPQCLCSHCLTILCIYIMDICTAALQYQKRAWKVSCLMTMLEFPVHFDLFQSTDVSMLCRL